MASEYMFICSSFDIFSKSLEALIAKAKRTDSWQVNAFVDATPISIPANIGNEQSLSREIELSDTLVKDTIFFALPVQYLRAAKVSAVSPDWLTKIASVFFLIGGSRYLNSDAISISTGIRAISSNQYFAT